MRLLFLRFLGLLAAPPPPKSLLSLNATVHECRVTKALLQSATAPASHEKATWQLESAAHVVNYFTQAGGWEGDRSQVRRAPLGAATKKFPYKNNEKNASLKKCLWVPVDFPICTLTQTKETTDARRHSEDAVPQTLAGWQQYYF